MIYIGNVRSPRPNMDANYAIVRSARTLNSGMKLCDILSPSQDLFFEYRRLANTPDPRDSSKTLWSPKSFEERYLPEFLSQMRYDPRAANILNSLVEMDKAGKKIELSCFCGQESMCHRSIVAGLLQGAGVRVHTATGADYSRYYDMYLSAPLTPMADKYLKQEVFKAQQAAVGARNGKEYHEIIQGQSSGRVLGREFDIPDDGSGPDNILVF